MISLAIGKPPTSNFGRSEMSAIATIESYENGGVVCALNMIIYALIFQNIRLLGEDSIGGTAGGDAVDDLVEGQLRLEADETISFGDIGNSAGHIFEARTIGDGIGDVLNGEAWINPGNNSLGKLRHRYFFTCAKVDDLALRLWAMKELHQSRDNFGNVAETATLSSIAENG